MLLITELFYQRFKQNPINMLLLFLFCDFLSVLTFLNVSAAAAHQQRAAEIYLIHDILQTHAGDHSKQERRD